MKTLIVGKDPALTERMTQILHRLNFSVHIATSAKEGIRFASEYSPHLIFVQLMLGDRDGIEVVSCLRSEHFLFHASMIVMSDRGEHYTQVAALDAGADDYLVLPFKTHWFEAKVKAWTRRFDGKSTTLLLDHRLEGLKIDHNNYAVTLFEENYLLSKKEFDILNLLISKPRKVFSRDEIQGVVWKSKQLVQPRTIDVHIHKLRDKLGNSRISTIKGVGYRFEL